MRSLQQTEWTLCSNLICIRQQVKVTLPLTIKVSSSIALITSCNSVRKRSRITYLINHRKFRSFTKGECLRRAQGTHCSLKICSHRPTSRKITFIITQLTKSINNPSISKGLILKTGRCRSRSFNTGRIDKAAWQILKLCRLATSTRFHPLEQTFLKRLKPPRKLKWSVESNPRKTLTATVDKIIKWLTRSSISRTRIRKTWEGETREVWFFSRRISTKWLKMIP